MSKKRKTATSPITSSSIRQEKRCIICGKPSNNGKFMCRRCAEEIKVDQEKVQKVL